MSILLSVGSQGTKQSIWIIKQPVKDHVQLRYGSFYVGFLSVMVFTEVPWES